MHADAAIVIHRLAPLPPPNQLSRDQKISDRNHGGRLTASSIRMRCIDFTVRPHPSM